MEKHRNITCLKSELDLFNNAPVQLVIDASSYVKVHPIASVTDIIPVEFYIGGSGEHYLGLAYTLLHLKIKVLKNNKSDLVDTDNVTSINYILNTLLFRNTEHFENKQVPSLINYSY